MLYLLTGEIESGKTSWLKRVIAAMQANEAALSGFISPAVFTGADQTFEKVAIDCQLLPEGITLRFGWRDDQVGNGAGALYSPPVSAVRLRWQFDDEVMRLLNDRLACYDNEHPTPGLLIVDELGFLEFRGRGGVTQALRILDEGCYQDAIAVMRPSLLDEAYQRWAPGAGGDNFVRIIEPGADLLVANRSYVIS